MVPVEKRGKTLKPFKMAAPIEECEIERFIKPVRGLYSDYSITIDKFKEENGLLLANYELEDLGDDVGYKLYAEFSEDRDGELARESVQTWICDNRLEVSNCICLALDNKKEAFCNWFRASEEHSSPDELVLYCLGKQNNLHVSIFNNKYVWSMLSNHIKYDYFEVVKKSDINLVFVGPRHYSIFRKKKAQTTEPEQPMRGKNSGTARGKGTRGSKKKTVCRSRVTNQKAKNTLVSVKRSQTLESARKERYGVGNKTKTGPSEDSDLSKYGRGKRRRGPDINYLKLNEGIDQDEPQPPSPKRTKHTPVRSGPSQERQTAQKRVTINPSVTTLSTVKTKKTADTGEDNADSLSTLIGVSTTNDPTSDTVISSVEDNTTKGVHDAFLGVPDANELLLPDLGTSREPTNDEIVTQTWNPVSEHSQDHSQEDEQDAVDALLSLSTMLAPSNSDFDFGLEDNALLAPIGGNVICEDVAPTESRLGQVEVDNQIAHLIAQEEHDKYTENQSKPRNSDLIGVPPLDTDENGAKKRNTVEDEPAAEPTQDTSDTPKNPSDKTDGHKGARPKTTKKDENTVADKPGSRGAFKSQLYGLRKSRPKDRAYKCKVCDKSKRSMEELNLHHRRCHDPQKCGVCGKVFELATTRVHHMYSHYARKYQCDRCSFHCFFNSELEAHKIVHREQPTFKCMYPQCG